MKKYRIYIDEVGNSDLQSSNDPNHRFLSLTGVILELDYVKSFVAPTIEDIKKRYFDHHPDEPVIFHRKELVNKKFPFTALKDPEIERLFNQEILEFLHNLDFTVITVLIDKKEHTNKYETWKYDPYHYCLEVLLERYFFFLKQLQAVGDVMIESRGGKEDMRLKSSYSKIYSGGTNFIKSVLLQQKLTSNNLKVKSKQMNVTGLQLADLVAHPSRRFVFRYYKLKEDKNYTFGERIIKILEEKYYSGKSGIEGYGIKLLP